MYLRFTLLSPNRPANILISRTNVPVLIDFGFAECYDTSKQDAFVSNLSYGTPEVRHTPSPPNSLHHEFMLNGWVCSLTVPLA